MVALARALRDREGIGVIFALNGSEDARQPIRRAGFDVTMLEHPCHLRESGARRTGPELLLLDGREGPSRAELEELKRHVGVTAVIDDGHERRLACDYAYYPPVPGALALDWSGVQHPAAHRLGMGAAGTQSQRLMPARARPSRPTVLVAMGGSDPHGLTLRMAKALAVLDQRLSASALSSAPA